MSTTNTDRQDVRSWPVSVLIVLGVGLLSALALVAMKLFGATAVVASALADVGNQVGGSGLPGSVSSGAASASAGRSRKSGGDETGRDTGADAGRDKGAAAGGEGGGAGRKSKGDGKERASPSAPTPRPTADWAELERNQDQYLKDHPEVIPQYQPPSSSAEQVREKAIEGILTGGGKAPR